MKKVALTAALLAMATGFAYAGEPQPVPAAAGRAVVTPYGDFCPQCSIYGVGKRPVGIGRAVAAARAYFENKGLTVGNIRGQHRFLVMDIYRGDRLVDRVLFDRRTGRLRSIY